MCPIGSYCVFPVYAATENLGYVDYFSLWQQLSLKNQQIHHVYNLSACIQNVIIWIQLKGQVTSMLTIIYIYNRKVNVND